MTLAGETSTQLALRDPDIRLITVRPDQAELWDSPNLLVSTALMLSAAVTGAKPKIGDNAKVSL